MSAADRVSYPVIVTYTQQHIVWVEADSPPAARSRLASWPYDSTSYDTTLLASEISVKTPQDRYDWEDVYGGDYATAYSAEADAHVETHNQEMWRLKRATEAAACAAADHPARVTYASGRTHCHVCKLELTDSTVSAGETR